MKLIISTYYKKSITSYYWFFTLAPYFTCKWVNKHWSSDTHHRLITHSANIHFECNKLVCVCNFSRIRTFHAAKIAELFFRCFALKNKQKTREEKNLTCKHFPVSNQRKKQNNKWANPEINKRCASQSENGLFGTYAMQMNHFMFTLNEDKITFDIARMRISLAFGCPRNICTHDTCKRWVTKKIRMNERMDGCLVG